MTETCEPPAAIQDLPPGPRPLPLHMAIQTLTWLGSVSALKMWNNGWLDWRPELRKRAENLKTELDAVDSDDFARAVVEEAHHRIGSFVSGVNAYRDGSRSPRPAAAPCVWSSGSAQLLDYGTRAPDSGPPVLVIPSLINRAYILDLTEQRSLMRSLAAAGLRPFLLDWGEPGETEAGFGLGDYVNRPLQAAFDWISTEAGRPPAIVGYCMGGLLALALAECNGDRPSPLALLATPWDFHAAGGGHVDLLNLLGPGLETFIATTGHLPIDVIQALFTSLDPQMGGDKFRRFQQLEPGSAAAKEFIALEDWLNDGVALVGGVARECLFGWYRDNLTGRGEWSVNGRRITPSDRTAPTLAIIPEHDHIVPPESALALAAHIPGCAVRRAKAGHIGMVAGSRSPGQTYRPLQSWIAENSA